MSAELYKHMVTNYAQHFREIRLKRYQRFNSAVHRHVVCFVLRGPLFLTVCAVDGREIILEILERGCCFGNGASVLGDYDYDIWGNRPSTLQQIGDDKFQALLNDDPPMQRLFTEALQQKYRSAIKHIEVLSQTHTVEKTRTGINWLSASYGVMTKSGVVIDLPISRIAATLGFTREELSRNISKLRQVGMVQPRTRRNNLVISLNSLRTV
jgi:CRP-like cAMP-binding protein